MEEAISFFRAFETWIYVLLALGGLVFIRRFLVAWQELRGANFGLERENAQTRLNQSASLLVLLLTMAIAEFVLVSFVGPSIPGAIPIPTSTLDLLATPTTTIIPGLPQQPEAIQATSQPNQSAASSENTCTAGQVEIVIPANAEEVSGIVPVVGSANIPNFGFYKFEIKRPDETVWLTIQAGNTPVQSGKLGDWDTSRLSPGDYQLALIAVDNQAKPSPACVIQVRVARAPEVTKNP